MALTIADIERWDAGDVREVFHAAHSRAQAAFDAADGLTTLAFFESFGGAAADAAEEAIGKTRKDLDAHGNEAVAVASAAGSAADNIEKIQSDLARLKVEARLFGLEIDPYSNRIVPIPHSTHGRREMQSKIATLQAQLSTLVEHANSVDVTLANAIQMADGTAPLPSTPSGQSSEQTRNQQDAFKQVYGRDPVSPTDWRMAAGLDKHSYQRDARGVPPNIVVGRIDRVPGAGMVQTNAFIDTATAPAGVLTNAGDNRGFDPRAMPDTSRVTFLIDYENGVVVARQNPSIKLDDGAVQTGNPDISVGQESNGNVHIKFNAADPFTPVLGQNTKALGISVDGDLFFQPTQGGGMKVGGNTSPYPCWEVNQFTTNGAATAILQDRPALDHPLTLIGPSKTIGDTSVISGYNIVPALAGEGAPPNPLHHSFPSAAPIAPPVVSVPMPTTPLGPASEPPDIPAVDPVVIVPTFVSR